MINCPAIMITRGLGAWAHDLGLLNVGLTRTIRAETGEVNPGNRVERLPPRSRAKVSASFLCRRAQVDRRSFTARRRFGVVIGDPFVVQKIGVPNNPVRNQINTGQRPERWRDLDVFRLHAADPGGIDATSVASLACKTWPESPRPDSVRRRRCAIRRSSQQNVRHRPAHHGSVRARPAPKKLGRRTGR
jgi:hypothetical protein